MRRDPLPPFQSEANVPDLPFAAADVLLRGTAAEAGLDLHVGHGRSIWCKRADGDEFGARMGGLGSILYARAHSRDRLHRLRDAFDDLLAAHRPDLRPSWSSLDAAGAHPPNFSRARVAAVRPLGANFLRLRLHGPDLDRFAQDLIHFRLILQPAGVSVPAWPVIGPDGRTLWPKGAAALHRPAYTVRAIDAEAGWMETDIFLHPGGRASDFARTATPGTEVGLTGPGGGTVPRGATLLIGGDETAYPALARTLEAAPPETAGECHLFGASADYPMPRHPGIRLVHAPAGEAALAARLRRQGCAARSIWIATERSRLDPLKTVLLEDLRIDKAQAHLAAYWSA